MQNDETNRARERRETPKSDPKRDSPKPTRAPIDLDAMDLSVENVEERISPRETNVFDK
ncbi:MAG: hypothetical protein ACYSWX_16570 [Planctomycetota bacterium]